MNSLCQTCRKMLYRTDPCKGDGVECGRTDGGSKKSTAARKDVPGSPPVIENRSVPGENGSGYPVNGEAKVLAASSEVPGTPAGTQAPPVDTPKPKHKDRHKPGYQAEKQKQYRAERRERERAAKGKVE